ncbi:MAG: glycoside hydrolase family 88 protein [Verrucomicrobiota bacterium]
MNQRFRRLVLSSLASAAACLAPVLSADPLAKDATNWPDGAAPASVGKRASENFLPREFRYKTNPAKAKLGVIYPEACTWQAALTVARLTRDEDLQKRLIAQFEPLLGEEGKKSINRSPHVDYRLFGIVPLTIYQINGDKRCLDLGLEFADAQWAKTTDDGITSEARYWIDDMFMIPAIQCEAYRTTRDAKYLDRAALAMTAYLEKLQQPNGLFHHGPDSAFFWGRGNGWVAAGMADLLRELPPEHALREGILKRYQKMMAALLPYQTQNGMWRQLVNDKESWEESSGTAMIAASMISGVKAGWLDAEAYAPAARKAWLALAKRVDASGAIADVCIGTDKGFSREFYLDRPRATGDLHGQTSVLWAAIALLRDAR